MMLRKDEERWEGELRSLRIELDKEKRVRTKLTMRKDALEQEVIELRRWAEGRGSWKLRSKGHVQ